MSSIKEYGLEEKENLVLQFVPYGKYSLDIQVGFSLLDVTLGNQFNKENNESWESEYGLPNEINVFTEVTFTYRTSKPISTDNAQTLQLATKFKDRTVGMDNNLKWNDLVYNEELVLRQSESNVIMTNDYESVIQMKAHVNQTFLRYLDSPYRVNACYGRDLMSRDIKKLEVDRVPMIEILQKYEDVFFELESKYDKGNLAVLKLNDVPIEYVTAYYNIRQFLEANQNNVLPLEKKTLTSRLGEVYAYDVDSYNFEYDFFLKDTHPRSRLHPEDKKDLLLTHKDKDYIKFGKHCLVSINGLFHLHDYSTDGICIVDGGTTIRKNLDKKHLNILDFTQVGSLKLVPIKPENIFKPSSISEIWDNVYVHLDEPINNRTLALVIGGYLHLNDHTYTTISDRIVKIDFNTISWETLFYKMKEIIDVTPLGLTDFGDDRVLGFELYHDTTIRKLLQLSQTFFVLIDNPNVKVDEIPVGHMGVPKRYETGLKPIYPLRIAEGRYPAYKWFREKDKWVLAVEDNIVPLQVRYQKPQTREHVIHNRVYPIHGEKYAAAHFVRIYSDIITETPDEVIPKLLDLDFNGGSFVVNNDDPLTRYVTLKRQGII